MPLDAPVIAITFTRIEDELDNLEDKTHGQIEAISSVRTLKFTGLVR